MWLGLIPLILLKRSFNETITREVLPTFSWFLSFIFLVILVTICSLRISRQIHISHKDIHILSGKFLGQYFFVRILFLVAYELFFRGLLLFDCIEWFGIFQAITFSTLLTVILHVFSGKKEMWACIPYGIISCCCCISIQAVWPAIILHLALSITYETSLLNRSLTHLKLVK